MNSHREFRPDLQDCMLEDRVTPVVSDLGVIVYFEWSRTTLWQLTQLKVNCR